MTAKEEANACLHLTNQQKRHSMPQTIHKKGGILKFGKTYVRTFRTYKAYHK